jgi:hypothetical protein
MAKGSGCLINSVQELAPELDPVGLIHKSSPPWAVHCVAGMACVQEQERRLKKALERAAAPVFKKVGKPVMFRSQAMRKSKPVMVDDRDEAEVELEAFLMREML